MPSSPRSVQIIQKNEALFTFDNHHHLQHHHHHHHQHQQHHHHRHQQDTIDDNDDNHIQSGYENGGSKVIVDGNKVYYHGSSSYKSDGDENFYDDQMFSGGYTKYSRCDAGLWKKRHTNSNKLNSSNTVTKPKKHTDDTMFPFDRVSLPYDSSGGGVSTSQIANTNAAAASSTAGVASTVPEPNGEWTKRPPYANNYYDSPSPDCDYYEQFRSASRKSTASNVSLADCRAIKELASLPRKQSLKLSKYDLPPSPSFIKNTDHNHKFKNHISESDAFNLPIAKPNAKINSTSSDITANQTTRTTTTTITTNTNTYTTTITTTTNSNTNTNQNNASNATTFSIVSQSSNNCANERNPVSQFEQIASKFDKIPSKVSHDCKYLSCSQHPD